MNAPTIRSCHQGFARIDVDPRRATCSSRRGRRGRRRSSPSAPSRAASGSAGRPTTRGRATCTPRSRRPPPGGSIRRRGAPRSAPGSRARPRRRRPGRRGAAARPATAVRLARASARRAPTRASSSRPRSSSSLLQDMWRLVRNGRRGTTRTRARAVSLVAGVRITLGGIRRAPAPASAARRPALTSYSVDEAGSRPEMQTQRVVVPLDGERPRRARRGPRPRRARRSRPRPWPSSRRRSGGADRVRAAPRRQPILARGPAGAAL